MGKSKQTKVDKFLETVEETNFDEIVIMDDNINLSRDIPEIGDEIKLVLYESHPQKQEWRKDGNLFEVYTLPVKRLTPSVITGELEEDGSEMLSSLVVGSPENDASYWSLQLLKLALPGPCRVSIKRIAIGKPPSGKEKGISPYLIRKI